MIAGDAASLFPYKEEVSGDEIDALFAPLAKRPAGNALAELEAAEWLRDREATNTRRCTRDKTFRIAEPMRKVLSLFYNDPIKS